MLDRGSTTQDRKEREKKEKRKKKNWEAGGRGAEVNPHRPGSTKKFGKS